MTKQSALSEEERANLVAYLDGELHGPAARALEAKLNTDPLARAEAEALKRTWHLLDYLPRPEPSPSFTHQTLSRVSAIKAVPRSAGSWYRRPWLLAAAWAAVVLVSGTLGFAASHWISSRRMPPPAENGPSAHHAEPGPAQGPAAAEQELARDLRVIENLRVYETINDSSFLRSLANPSDPDLFGDENADS